jgi:hypothetical protein
MDRCCESPFIVFGVKGIKYVPCYPGNNIYIYIYYKDDFQLLSVSVNHVIIQCVRKVAVQLV